ncbi:MAG TPA: glycosyltransferase family 39 protein, partial [Pirellulales bacterium]|nr:glycosyltransferase family 39 protein [Pirellulales bacterium]
MSITGPATRYGPRVAEGRPLHEQLLSWQRGLAATATSPALVLVGIAALALLLRLPNYASRDLWDDELIQYHICTAPSLAEMFQSLVRSDRNPPGFALLARAALQFSDSDMMLRLPSLLGGMGAVVLAWYAGKSWLGTQGAAVTAAIAAVCPTYIFFSREARPYSVGLCAVYAYLVCLNAFRNGPSLRKAVLLGSVSAAAISVQYANIPLVGVTLATAAVVSFLSGQRNWRSLGCWGLVAVVAAGAVAIDVARFLVPQVSVHGTGKTDFLRTYFFDLASLRSACEFIPHSTAGFLSHISLTEMMAPGWQPVCLLGWLPLAAGVLVVGWDQRACERRPTINDVALGGPALASSLVPP